MFHAKLFILLAIICVNFADIQTSSEKKTHIEGIFLYDRLENTIEFSNKWMDAKYFQIPYLEARVSNKKFSIDATITYPQLYTLSFKSERGKISSYGGDYFIDSTTTSISMDSIVGCSGLNGKTYLEYKNRFLPFMMDGKTECKLAFIERLKESDENGQIIRKNIEFDELEEILKTTCKIF